MATSKDVYKNLCKLLGKTYYEVGFPDESELCNDIICAFEDLQNPVGKYNVVVSDWEYGLQAYVDRETTSIFCIELKKLWEDEQFVGWQVVDII